MLIEAKLLEHSHCTFASRKNGSTPFICPSKIILFYQNISYELDWKNKIGGPRRFGDIMGFFKSLQ